MNALHFALSALLASTLALGCDPGDEPEPAQAQSEPEQHCAMVVSKLRPGQAASDVISRACAATEEELDKSAALSADDVLIMTWYSDAKYEGDSEKIYGDAGPCDDTGYGIPNVGVYDDIEWPFGGWNDMISSFKSWNYCNHVTAYEHENWGGREESWHDPNAAGLGVEYVGDNMNDAITSFWVKRGDK
jgi:hypothetical protein